MNSKFLANYVDVIVRTGLAVESNDEVIIWADVESYDFTRKVVKRCYKSGAKEVLVNYYDQVNDLEYIINAPKETLNKYPNYMFKEYAERTRNGAAVLVIWSKIPSLTSDVDKDRLLSFMKAFNYAKSPLWNQFMLSGTRRCIVACPIEEWAEIVYKDLDKEEALERLWENLFIVTRTNTESYLDEWKKHIDILSEKVKRLNSIEIEKIHLKTNLSDLTIGFPDNNIWSSALLQKENGMPFFANIPSEEIMTTPHKYKINGYVTSTKPLVYNGNTIDKISFSIINGKIVEYKAEVGQDILESILNVDDNAYYFGEIALVSNSSPITKLETTFLNILFDENASSHMAFGNGFSLCVKGAENMTEEEKDAYGINQSKIHIDFMIGDESLCVKAFLKSGEVITIMNDGEWINF